MSLNTEALFTATLGLQAPRHVERSELSTSKRRIDFDVVCTDLVCTESRLSCLPHSGMLDQGNLERAHRSRRHLNLLQLEGWHHVDISSVACSACGRPAKYCTGSLGA